MIEFLVVFFVVMVGAVLFLLYHAHQGDKKQSKDVEIVQQEDESHFNRLNTLLNSISDAVLTINRYGRVTSQNSAAQAFFDTNQSLVGKDIESILEPKDNDGQPVSIHDLIRAVKSSSVHDNLSVLSGDETKHLSIQLSRIRGTFDHDEEYGVVMIIRDITKQKTLEEEKDEFVSVTSHELRTPVAIAEGSLSNLIMMQDKDADPKVLKEAAQTAYDQVLYLSGIINDLSTLSRADRGVGDTVEEVDIDALVHELYKRYESEASAKSLKLNVETDGNLPHVETSRLYIEEILQNFITNAIKYTKEGSITISAKMKPNGRILCSVKDTGIGMSKTDLEHIFERFYRSEDYRTRETNGTGLGLYVVSKLAAKLGTKIDVQSRLNHGSTFSFEISLRSVKANTAAKPVANKQYASS